MAAACREHFSDLTWVMSSCTSGRSCNESEAVHTLAGGRRSTPGQPAAWQSHGHSRGAWAFKALPPSDKNTHQPVPTGKAKPRTKRRPGLRVTLTNTLTLHYRPSGPGAALSSARDCSSHLQ